MGVKTFCKLTTTGNKTCYLLSDVEDHGKEGIKLTMSDGESAWSGELTGDDLEDLSHKIKMKFPDFLAETVKAFTRENVGNLNFLYQIRTCNDDAMELTWKKYVAVDEIKFQLGKVVLESMPDPAKFNRDVFTYCIENMVELKTQINSLETDTQRLSQERGQALKRLDKCVTAKEDVEKDLYSKFVAVLNSKKEKIRELKREIDEGGTKSNGTEQKAVAGSSTTRETEDIEMSDQDTKVEERLQSDEDRTTDDEVTPPTKRRRGGANVKRILSDSADNSLVLDDGEDIQPSAASRRPRRQASGRKATPSKPVLPRVRSGDRGQSASDRRTSMRKSGSGSSSKSASEVLDAEDLLEDL